MTSVGWKLSCAVLAAIAAASWLRPPGAAVWGPSEARSGGGACRPPRARAAADGAEADTLVVRLLEATTVGEVRALAGQLGAAGDDASIDAVLRLLGDTREGVPEAVVRAIGAIGTDHAVDVLIDVAHGRRTELATAAIEALASTGQGRAEQFLIDRARRQDPDAIDALGQLATDRAVDLLSRLAAAGTDDPAHAAVRALGEIDTPGARQAIARLVDSPAIDTASAALAAVKQVDATMRAKLVATVTSGERALWRPALLALARADERALPVLRSLAEVDGSEERQLAAIEALAVSDEPEAVEILGGLLEHDSEAVARAAARSLAALDDPAAIDLLCAAALSERAEVTDAVEVLLSLQSEEIDPVLLELARADLHGASSALARLLAREHPEALALVVARAGSLDVDERLAALELLSDAASEPAFAALLALARAEQGELKPRALALLVATRPGAPEVLEVLVESLYAPSPEERGAAATALGKVGTDPARDALVRALAMGDLALATEALTALEAYRLDAAAVDAVVATARAHRELRCAAVRRLLSAGVPEGIPLARSVLDGDDAGDALQVISLLRESDLPVAGELIVHATRASSADVRVAALYGLGRVQGEVWVGAVQAALRDDDARVRYAALGAIGSSSHPRAEELLLAATAGGPSRDRAVAISYVGRYPSARPRVRQLARDRDDDVAYTAMRTLLDDYEDPASVRALVFDASVPHARRLDAARMVERFGALDESMRAWLDRERAIDQVEQGVDSP